MLIENIMYFALGVLVAGLVSLIILPAVWKRAVRLTKRRIEAATPITMAEFRADKDQLRAEFALSTRKLEMNVETLRKRLAEQMGDYNQKRSDFGQLQAERDQHLAIVKELQAREAELRARVAELERDNTDLAQRLRMRDREMDVRTEELAKLRQDAGGVNTKADDITAAEARIASAESRLNALLANSPQAELLADQLNLDADVETLRQKVGGVEAAILTDWNSDRLDETALRQRLSDIATSVSRLVYAADTEKPAANDMTESLFDRVQRFADEVATPEPVPVKPAKARKGSSVTDRMAALKEIQGR